VGAPDLSKPGGVVVSKVKQLRERGGSRLAVSALLATSLVAALAIAPLAVTSSATASQVVCSGAPVKGGNLVYARQAGPVTLNPFFPTNGNGDIFADTLLYQGLVMPDPTGKTQNIEPAVASSWTESANGMSYTFHIRPGIKFSNGAPVTAADVVFSLDYFANPKLDETAVLSGGFKSATAVNSSTVLMKLTAPTPGLIYNMSIFDAFIVPKALATKEGAKFWDNPVGTGPFKLSKWVRGSSITFVRNPYYWQPGLPYLNSVTYQYALNDNTRLLDVENNQAQMADGIAFNQVATVKSNSNLTLQSVKVPYWVGLWMNFKRKPFQNLDVRKALEYAINRPLINKTVFDGLGTIPNSVLPQLKYDAANSVVKPYSYDLSLAKSYMAKSDYPKGFTITLQYPSGYVEYTNLVLILQAEWASIGVHVKLQAEDEATETALYMKGQYDMTFPYAEFTSDVTVPEEYATFVTTYGGGGYSFYSWWNDPIIAKMVTTFDHTASEATQEIQWPKIQAAMQDQTPFINVMDLPFLNAHRDDVCGTVLDPLGADSLQYTWIAK
jgi:peptide/nickel transport system substrate-binding protein